MWGVCLGTLAGLADCKLRCQLHLGKCGYKYAFVSRGSQSRISWLEIWVMERVRPVTVPRLREVSLLAHSHGPWQCQLGVRPSPWQVLPGSVVTCFQLEQLGCVAGQAQL